MSRDSFGFRILRISLLSVLTVVPLIVTVWFMKSYGGTNWQSWRVYREGLIWTAFPIGMGVALSGVWLAARLTIDSRLRWHGILGALACGIVLGVVNCVLGALLGVYSVFLLFGLFVPATYAVTSNDVAVSALKRALGVPAGGARSEGEP